MILNSVLQNGLKGRFSQKFNSQLTSSAFASTNSKLSYEDKELISKVYVRDLHTVFITSAILAAALFISILFIHDDAVEGGSEEQSEGAKPSHLVSIAIKEYYLQMSDKTAKKLCHQDAQFQ